MNQITSTKNIEVLHVNTMQRESRNWCIAEDRMVNDKYVPKSHIYANLSVGRPDEKDRNERSKVNKNENACLCLLCFSESYPRVRGSLSFGTCFQASMSASQV